MRQTFGEFPPELLQPGTIATLDEDTSVRPYELDGLIRDVLYEAGTPVVLVDIKCIQYKAVVMFPDGALAPVSLLDMSPIIDSN